GFQVVGYASAQAFGDAAPQPVAQGACILCDIRMPRTSGLELQRQLNAAACDLPLVFMTGHGDVEQAVQAMRAGAVHFLQKPFKEQAVLEALNAAIDVAMVRWQSRQRTEGARALLEQLTPREQD